MKRALPLLLLCALASPAAAQAPAGAAGIDQLVAARLAQLGVRAADSCSDDVFVRRVFLDVIGTLPTAAEVRAFAADQSGGKRASLIDALLEREEFADYWALKWSELLRVKSEFPINLWPNAVQAYHAWIRESIRGHLPYDQFARALLTSSGSNFRVPPVNFYRAVQGREPRALASAVALTFMGERTQGWPAARLAGMAGFFSDVGYKSTLEWKEEIVFFDRERRAEDERVAGGVFPDGTPRGFAPDEDPRQVFADWLAGPENPWFARAIANRVWAWLLGRGIIHEPDDIRPDNPPVNPELLAHLEHELVAADWDLRHLFRIILNSRTYQRSSVAIDTSALATANFAHYPARPLEAEVLIDAINQITGGTEEYSSAIPEPFTFVPDDRRSIQLADGSIGSAFLTTFGRPSRDVGLESERNRVPSAAERLALLNSSHVQRKLESGPALQALSRRARDGGQLLNQLYLTILSRLPTPAEAAAVAGYAAADNPRRALVVDIAWALINTPEFLYRH